MPQQTRIGDVPTRTDAVKQANYRVDLRRREVAIAEFVAGIDDLDADRTAIDVGVALPERHAGVPGAALFGHQAIDLASFVDAIVRRDLGLGIAHALKRRLGGSHAGIVQDAHIRRRGTFVEIGRRQIDQGHLNRLSRIGSFSKRSRSSPSCGPHRRPWRCDRRGRRSSKGCDGQRRRPP